MFKMIKSKSFLVSCFLLLLCLAAPLAAQARSVIIKTALGDIELELLEADAPKTVTNFLNYINNDRYKNSFIHRSISGFIIQGGGFTFDGSKAVDVPTFPAVENEFKVSNTRGTVAMAKKNNQPNSATSQWFINVGNNASNLDGQNGGFTVFARVIGGGMAVVDAVNQLPRVNAGGAFTDLPVIDFSGNGALTTDNLVMTAVSEKLAQASFVMNAGFNDAWFNIATDGQGFFITVFPGLGIVSLAWFTYDTMLPQAGLEAVLGNAGHRWLTALGPIDGNRSVMEIDIVSGGIFDTPTTVIHTPGGTITLTFTDCNSGTIEYNIPSISRQGSVPIKRVANDNIALCEALLAQ